MMSSLAARSAGLCSTCNNNNNGVACGYRALRGYDALFCEMFDISPDGRRGEVKTRFVTVKTSAVSEETGPEVYKGLCINCENRETCRLAKSEGGIWHCEEYK